MFCYCKTKTPADPLYQFALIIIARIRRFKVIRQNNGYMTVRVSANEKKIYRETNECISVYMFIGLYPRDKGKQSSGL